MVFRFFFDRKHGKSTRHCNAMCLTSEKPVKINKKCVDLYDTVLYNERNLQLLSDFEKRLCE